MFDLLGMWLGKTGTLETSDSMPQQAANDEVNHFSCILCFWGIYVLANSWFLRVCCVQNKQKRRQCSMKNTAQVCLNSKITTVEPR